MCIRDRYAVDSAGNQLWRYPAQADVRGPVCVGPDGSVYFGSDDNLLYRVSAGGGLVWHFAAGWFVRAGPTLADNGRVYFGANDDQFYAVDSAGALVWRLPAGGPVTGSCLLDEAGVVYFAAGSKVYAVSGTGRLAASHWPTCRHDPARTGRAGP